MNYRLNLDEMYSQKHGYYLALNGYLEASSCCLENISLLLVKARNFGLINIIIKYSLKQ